MERFIQVRQVERLSNEDILTLSKFYCMDPKAIPKPKYKKHKLQVELMFKVTAQGTQQRLQTLH
jgi:hypothetical protein